MNFPNSAAAAALFFAGAVSIHSAASVFCASKIYLPVLCKVKPPCKYFPFTNTEWGNNRIYWLCCKWGRVAGVGRLSPTAAKSLTAFVEREKKLRLRENRQFVVLYKLSENSLKSLRTLSESSPKAGSLKAGSPKAL